MVEDQEEMAARVEELIKMVKAGNGIEGDSDEEDDDDVEIVGFWSSDWGVANEQVTADTSLRGVSPLQA